MLAFTDSRPVTPGPADARPALVMSHSMWAAPFEVDAHVAAGRAAGLPEAALDALKTGSLAPELTDREQLAWRFARQLSGERRVEGGLFAEAREAFGERELVDLVMLVGSYLFTSAVLNAFEVPAPADGPAMPAALGR